MAVIEPELPIIRRAFPKAQQLLAAPAVSIVGTTVDVGWHGTDAHPELGGSHALVRVNAGLDDLIGEVLRITRGDQVPVFVYVLGARDVPTDVSLARRAFLAVGLLSAQSYGCRVEVAS